MLLYFRALAVFGQEKGSQTNFRPDKVIEFLGGNVQNVTGIFEAP